MTDLHWYRTRLQELEDRRWTLNRAAQDVADFEDGLRRLWEDSAARDIRSRYTLPLEEEHGAARAELARMSTALQQMHARLEQVQQHAVTLMQLSGRIDEALAEVAHETDRAHQERERAGRMTAQVLSQAAEIDRYIEMANRTEP